MGAVDGSAVYDLVELWVLPVAQEARKSGFQPKLISYLIKDYLNYMTLYIVALIAISFLLLILYLYLSRKTKAASVSEGSTAQTASTPIKLDSNPPKPAEAAEAAEAKAAAANGKKKKKKAEGSWKAQAAKSGKELQEVYGEQYYGSISIKNQKNLSVLSAVAVKNSKILFGTSRNQLCMYDLRKWKLHAPAPEMYFTSLENNTATALAITPNFYFAALSFDKTIAYYEFKGGEGGVYFREVKKFARNIYKGSQGNLAVSESEKFIVSTGIEADTTISVWSMSGQKLAGVSSYQIEHYEVQFGGNLLLIRGWTSEVKGFKLVSDKEGQFVRLDKSLHLTHTEKPSAAAIDNLGLYALTITAEGDQLKFWHLGGHSPHETTVQACQIGVQQPKHCAILTLRNENERLRTVAIVANAHKMVVLDKHMKVLKQFEHISVDGLYSFGATRSAVVATMSSGRMSVWDLTKLVQEQPEYTL